MVTEATSDAQYRLVRHGNNTKEENQRISGQVVQEMHLSDPIVLEHLGDYHTDRSCGTFFWIVLRAEREQIHRYDSSPAIP